jgi:GTP-binding protein
MTLPKIAIIGRPNVGKSSLFNRICKKREAIVHEEEGVTRDLLYGKSSFFSKPFAIIDSAGIDPKAEGVFTKLMEKQAKIGANEADVIVFVVDGRVGITIQDERVAKFLFTLNKPIILAINKMDGEHDPAIIQDFYSLGVKDMVLVSALHNIGIDDLLEKALEDFSGVEEEEEDKHPQIAFIGRPNVGKSTLFNHLVGQERSMVSEIAGTTRDQIDMLFEKGDKKYTFIDTAGVIRKNKARSVIDKFSAIRTEKAIKKSNLCLLLINIKEGLTSQEKKILSMVAENKKGCILLLNKWDLVQDHKMEHALRHMREQNPILKDIPTLIISAKTKRNIEKIFPLIDQVYHSLSQTLSTSKLNQFVETVMQKYHPPMIMGKRLRVYYMTQVGKFPPAFILFVNYPHLFCPTYKKYLINQLKKTFKLHGVFVSFFIRGKKQEEAFFNSDKK